MRRAQPGRASPLGRLFADLQKLRSREGLTRTKAARATVLCGLSVVRAEAARLDRPPEEVAYHLLIATVHGLKDASGRDYLINALALDHTPPGAGLTDRRRRYAARLDESRVRDHEDAALEEVARWLLEMTDPEVLFGDYTSEAAPPPPVEWNVGQVTGPVARDEIHPREEVAWDLAISPGIGSSFLGSWDGQSVASALPVRNSTQADAGRSRPNSSATVGVVQTSAAMRAFSASW